MDYRKTISLVGELYSSEICLILDIPRAIILRTEYIFLSFFHVTLCTPYIITSSCSVLTVTAPSSPPAEFSAHLQTTDWFTGHSLISVAPFLFSHWTTHDGAPEFYF